MGPKQNALADARGHEWPGTSGVDRIQLPVHALRAERRPVPGQSKCGAAAGRTPAFCRGAIILRTRPSVEERAQSDDRRIRTGPSATGDRISEPIELCKERSYLRFRI